MFLRQVPLVAASKPDEDGNIRHANHGVCLMGKKAREEREREGKNEPARRMGNQEAEEKGRQAQGEKDGEQNNTRRAAGEGTTHRAHRREAGHAGGPQPTHQAQQ